MEDSTMTEAGPVDNSQGGKEPLIEQELDEK